MSHTGHMGVVVLPVSVARHAHYEQRHLLVALEEVPVGAVHYGVDVFGAGVYLPHGALKDLVALGQRTLIGAEHAVVLAGEGVAEAVLQKRAGADDYGRLAEVFQHG